MADNRKRLLVSGSNQSIQHPNTEEIPQTHRNVTRTLPKRIQAMAPHKRDDFNDHPMRPNSRKNLKQNDTEISSRNLVSSKSFMNAQTLDDKAVKRQYSNFTQGAGQYSQLLDELSSLQDKVGKPSE